MSNMSNMSNGTVLGLCFTLEHFPCINIKDSGVIEELNATHSLWMAGRLQWDGRYPEIVQIATACAWFDKPMRQHHRFTSFSV